MSGNRIADAISQFLDKSEKQAGHDPDAISRLEQDNEVLREALETLQDRIEHGLAPLGGDGAVLQDLQERVENVEYAIMDVTRQDRELQERVNSLEAAKEDPSNMSRKGNPSDFSRKETRPKKAAQHNPRRKAFFDHYFSMRQRYHLRRPGKDQRSFVWSFIEGINDKECARFIQEYLIDEIPGKAGPRKSPKDGRIMALTTDIKWEDVKKAMSHLPEPPFWT